MRIGSRDRVRDREIGVEEEKERDDEFDDLERGIGGLTCRRNEFVFLEI